MTAPDAEAARPAPQSARKAAFAGLLGTAIKGYDFAVYAYLVVFLAPVFFPAHNQTAGILAATALACVGSRGRSRWLGCGSTCPGWSRVWSGRTVDAGRAGG